MMTRFSEMDSMFGTMDLLRNKMERLFNEFDRSWAYGTGSRLISGGPRTNLIEEADTYKVQAELPGINKEDLDIKIQGNYLEISGERTVKVPEGYKVHRSERVSNPFSRSFTLPDEVNADKVDATLKDGILTLILPKSETAKPKQITIN